MRKLAVAEVAILATALAASQGTSADEPGISSTVFVTGSYTSYSSSINFGWWTPSTISTGSIPSQLGIFPGYQSAWNLHALDCARSYMPNVGGLAGATGPRPGWKTYIVSNYGWRDGAGNRYQTLGDTPPTSDSIQLGGTTYPGVNSYSFVFLPGAGGSMDYLIQNLSHEWAHQWGAVDDGSGSWNDAYAIGIQTMNAWRADGGAKCGGL